MAMLAASAAVGLPATMGFAASVRSFIMRLLHMLFRSTLLHVLLRTGLLLLHVRLLHVLLLRSALVKLLGRWRALRCTPVVLCRLRRPHLVGGLHPLAAEVAMLTPTLRLHTVLRLGRLMRGDGRMIAVLQGMLLEA